MIILGIDPGSKRIGYGLIKKNGGRLSYFRAGILKIKKQSAPKILQETKKEVDRLIKKFRPKILAIEKLYFARNQKTALAVAESRGVIVLAATENGLEIVEYSPNEIKAGVAGYGFADKKAVAKMVSLALGVPTSRMIDDASDALAAALLAGQRHGLND